MAQLALASGGAAVGGAYGGPLGAQAGWIIGSVIGGILFKNDDVEIIDGPRLGDQTVTSSAYGAPVPVGYGTMRLSGNMIWSEGIEERQTLTEQGGGGPLGGIGKGGAPSTTALATYTYFATFALAFAEGPAKQVLRVWADGKLIFDNTGIKDDIAKADFNFRFYPGSETQKVDSLIRDDKGANAPAYRGLTYVVFSALPLADFGNRIPNITAEITFDGGNTLPTEDLSLIAGPAPGFEKASLIPDYFRGVFYYTDADAIGEDNYLRRASTRDMQETRQVQYITDALGNDVRTMRLQAIADNGYLLASTDSGNSQPLSLINPDTLGIIDTFGTSNSNVSFDPDGFAILDTGKSSAISCTDWTGPLYFILCAGTTDSIGILKVFQGTNLEYIWDSDSAPNQLDLSFADANADIRGTCGGAVREGFGVGYILAGDGYGSPDSADVNLYRIIIRQYAEYFAGATLPESAYMGVEFELLRSFTPAELIPGETLLNDVKGPTYDVTDDTIMFQVEGNSDSQAYMLKIDTAPDILGVVDPQILWRTAIPSMRNFIGGMGNSRLEGGLFGQIDADRAWALETAEGDLLFNEDGWSPNADNAGSQWFDSRTRTIVASSDATSGVTKYYLFRGDGAGTTLDRIVEDQCLRAGLDQSEIDVTDLADLEIPGYMIARTTPARGSIQTLASAFFFDGVESDYALKFSKRDGKTLSATVTQDELVTLDDNTGEFIEENRIQEVELPERFTITYMNANDDYQQAVHNAKRTLNPIPTMNSRNQLQLQVAAALTPDFAKQAAEKALYSSWIERSTYSVQLPWTYLALDPSDLIEITLDNGTIFRTRLIEMNIGGNFNVDASAISEQPAQYTSNVEADGGNSGLIQTFLPSFSTKLFMFCAPLLRDIDDTGRIVSNQYFGMGGFGQPGWRTGILFISPDGSVYSQEGSVTSELGWGAAVNALGDTGTPFQTDETNTLTVYMNTGAELMSSVTQAELLNGANGAMLIHANGIDIEVLQFRDVTVNADDSLTLSGLLRGRRGSEVFTGGHQAGDQFILLNGFGIGALQLDLGSLNNARFYKGLTNGQQLEEATVVAKTSPGVDLKPYAVVQQKAEDAGGNDIDLTWVRRTRLGGGLQNNLDTVPLNEDTEEYEVDILDGPDGNIVRGVTGLTDPEYTYTSALQTADGFSPPLSQITVRIYQISAQVGRGFTKEVTLNVE